MDPDIINPNEWVTSPSGNIASRDYCLSLLANQDIEGVPYPNLLTPNERDILKRQIKRLGGQ